MEHFVKVTVAKASSMQYEWEYLVTFWGERLLGTTSSFVGSSNARSLHANQIKPAVQDMMMAENSYFYSQHKKSSSWVVKWKKDKGQVFETVHISLLLDTFASVILNDN